MLSHLKELQAEKKSYDHVDSAVDMSPGGYIKTPSSLNDVEGGRTAQEQEQEAQEKEQHQAQRQSQDPVQLCDNRDVQNARDKRESEKMAHDSQFRVNGIVVDHEVKGGARTGWENVYEIMYKSSTSTGQRVALVLLVMVSMSVAVGG